jgi:putative MATE family efflux protein
MLARDMTKGSPLRHLIGFAIPVLIGNLFQNLYNIVDSMIVGRYLGVDALAAVGSVGILFFCTQGLAIGMTSGYGVIFSQYYGGKQESEMRHHVAVAACVSVVYAAIITAILFVVIEPVMGLMNVSGGIYEDALIYARICFAGFTATLSYNFIAATARAIGDSRSPLYFLIFSSLLNVVLDIVMIRAFQMGVAGAALATVLSQLVSAVLSGIYMLKRYPILRIKKAEARFRWESAVRLLKIGIPMALQFFITALGGIVLQSVTNKMGEIAIAAHLTGMKTERLVEELGIAMGAALATYVGQNVGAGEKERIQKGVRQGMLVILAASVIMGAFFWVFGKYAGLLFLSESNAEMMNLLDTYFHVVTWAFIPLGMIFVYRNALQGLGDGFFPMLGGAFELLGRIAAVILIGTSRGFAGICSAHAIAWTAAIIPLVPVYYIRIHRFPEKKAA